MSDPHAAASQLCLFRHPGNLRHMYPHFFSHRRSIKSMAVKVDTELPENLLDASAR